VIVDVDVIVDVIDTVDVIVHVNVNDTVDVIGSRERTQPGATQPGATCGR
jgi:hypothetical protein